jgi:hypothetical protein
MAKDAEKAEAKTPSDSGKEAEQQQAVRAPIQIDDEKALATYANFCRVTGTPEELIIDVGLNSQPVGPQTEAIKINQRLVLNYFTAKRLLAALQMSIQRHEAAFGVLETDVQKRVQPSAMAAANR